VELVRIAASCGGVLRKRERSKCAAIRTDWHPDLPDAGHEPLIPLLWLKVHELLGRVPEGSTARFVKDGTLPGDVQQSALVHRLAG
jgi:hypothetical protein